VERDELLGQSQAEPRAFVGARPATGLRELFEDPHLIVGRDPDCVPVR
jgi:hypothetical protein